MLSYAVRRGNLRIHSALYTIGTDKEGTHRPIVQNSLSYSTHNQNGNNGKNGENGSMTELIKDSVPPESFYNALQNFGINFFCGVPDSLLKYFCAYMDQNVCSKRHIIAANEGNAIAIATGYHLATGGFPLVYMQNSGLGNAVNPLVSLTHKRVYRIPMLLLIGWRGELGRRDEPQHMVQGVITPSLLATLDVSFQILPDYESGVEEVLETAHQHMVTTGSPYGLIVRKNTFSKFNQKKTDIKRFQITRERAIQVVLDVIEREGVLVSSTGMISREVFEYRVKQCRGNEADFLTVGSMGHTSSIALGVALQTSRKVICLDGDGSVLMHMGAMATIGHRGPSNFIHILLNNECHDSVGGQPTDAANEGLSFTGIASACGYKHVFTTETEDGIIDYLNQIQSYSGPILLEIKVNSGHRSDIGRPSKTLQESKSILMKSLQNEKP